MEHPKLRLNTQTNIFNRMFHIFFLFNVSRLKSGCFVCELSKAHRGQTYKSWMLLRCVPILRSYPTERLHIHATAIYGRCRGNIHNYKKFLMFSFFIIVSTTFRRIVDYLPFILLYMDCLTKNNIRFSVMTFLVMVEYLVYNSFCCYTKLS